MTAKITQIFQSDLAVHIISMEYSASYMTDISYNQKLSHSGGSYMHGQFSQAYPMQGMLAPNTTALLPMYPYYQYHQSQTMGVPAHVFPPTTAGPITSIPTIISKPAAMAPAADLPGFYFDPEKKRYFPIKGRVGNQSPFDESSLPLADVPRSDPNQSSGRLRPTVDKSKKAKITRPFVLAGAWFMWLTRNQVIFIGSHPYFKSIWESMECFIKDQKNDNDNKHMSKRVKALTLLQNRELSVWEIKGLSSIVLREVSAQNMETNKTLQGKSKSRR
ncbi:hypothetical protein QJS10_CPB20g00341 [Acorus calamus]|uniref:Uncharacterized protein n=1 Tax=Acorus calamus TaxID=4465 RepID=A0AAV9CD87_ACOCL|nr:hypothetical protein QJS10_CPB20g00341 [Acorus calamus]